MKIEHSIVFLCVESFLIVVCILYLIPFFIAGFYNFPAADDFVYGISVHRIVANGGTFFDALWGALLNDIAFYNSWQGLYTSAFFNSLVPSIWGEQWYALVPFILIGSSILSIFFTLSWFFECIKEFNDSTYEKYYHQNQDRLKKYHDENLDIVVVDPIYPKPKLLFAGDISIDKNYWTNVGISEYYEKTIYLSEPDENYETLFVE